MSLAAVVLVLGLVVLLSNLQALLTGMPAAGKALLSLPWLVAASAVITAVFAVLAWLKGYWKLAARVHYTAIALVGLIFTGWLVYWNLLPLG